MLARERKSTVLDSSSGFSFSIHGECDHGVVVVNTGGRRKHSNGRSRETKFSVLLDARDASVMDFISTLPDTQFHVRESIFDDGHEVVKAEREGVCKKSSIQRQISIASSHTCCCDGLRAS